MERWELFEKIELISKGCYKCKKYTKFGEKYLKLGNYYQFWDREYYGNTKKTSWLRWERLCEKCFRCLQCSLRLVNIYYKSNSGEVFCGGCVNELQLDITKHKVFEFYCMKKNWIDNNYYYFEDTLETDEIFQKERAKRRTLSKNKINYEDKERAKELFWYWGKEYELWTKRREEKVITEEQPIKEDIKKSDIFKDIFDSFFGNKND